MKTIYTKYTQEIFGPKIWSDFIVGGSIAQQMEFNPALYGVGLRNSMLGITKVVSLDEAIRHISEVAE